MREGIWRHVTRNAVAYLALFVALTGTAYGAARIGSAQIADNSIRSIDIRDRGVKGVDIGRRTLRAEHFRPGVLRRGARGAPGATGATGAAGPIGPAGARGPSFGDTRQVGNVNDIACNQQVTIATLALTTTEPARIWTHGQGAIRKDGAPVTEGALWLRLRDASGAELANSVPAWDADAGQTGDALWALSPGGLLRAGADPFSAASAPFVAPAGAYTLELVALAQGGVCTTAVPDFGWNQGGAMGYVLLGTG
jgi:hypothetical protein